jgi:uncharacterized membrane protein YbhN (UPF0104 family)
MLTKKNLINLLKWGFSISVLVLLVKSGKLSLTDIQNFLAHPYHAGACLLIVAGIFLCAFQRWRFLLAGVGIDLSYGTIFRLGMLGQFFSAIIPGTVGGDLVKAVYVAKRYPQLKAKTLSTILLDRFMGLFALVILGGAAFLMGMSRLQELPGSTVVVIQSLGWILAAAGAGILAFLVIFSKAAKFFPKKLPSFLAELPFLGKVLSSLYEVFLAYQSQVSALWKALGISFLIHFGNMGVLYIASLAIFGPAPWGSLTGSDFILGAVLGNCAMAIPVAPLGLGVGQFAFSAIFVALGAPGAGFGSAIVTAFQMTNLMLNLTGSVFFATYKNEAEASMKAAV